MVQTVSGVRLCIRQGKAIPDYLTTLIIALPLPSLITNGKNTQIKHNTASPNPDCILPHMGNLAKSWKFEKKH